MSVIVADNQNSSYDGYLSTASGFYRAEAYNLACLSLTSVSVGTGYNLSVTFANAGNLMGVMFGMLFIGSTCSKTLTVKLQEQTAPSVWTDRASDTLTSTEIFNGDASVTGQAYGALRFLTFHPVDGSSNPYAVTAAASTWRFNVTMSSSSGDNFAFITSDGTNPFYCAWCDTKVTASSGNDALVLSDPIAVDTSFVLKSYLGTGSTTYGFCGIVGMGATHTTPNFTWKNPASASYTLTVDGHIMLGTDSGVKFGTALVPITAANQGIVKFVVDTVGSSPTSGFFTYGGSNIRSASRCNFEVYGQVPSRVKTTLAQTANTGQAHIITTDDTSTQWAATDQLFIPKQGVKAQGDTTVYTISSISGTDITLTANIATNARVSGGSVVRINGFGFKFYSNSTGSNQLGVVYLPMPSLFTVSGVQIDDVYVYTYAGSPTSWLYQQPLSAFKAQHVFQDIVARSTSTTYRNLLSPVIPPEGCLVQRVYTHRVNLMSDVYGYYSSGYKAGTIEIKNCIVGNNYSSYIQGYSNNLYFDVEDNSFENAGPTANCGFMRLNGVGGTYKNNYFYGAASTYGAAEIGQLISPIEISGNTFDNNTVGVGFALGAICLNAVEENSAFGVVTANTTDIDTAYCSANLLDYTFSNCATLTTITTAQIQECIDGTKLRFVNYSDTSNDDRVYTPFGNFQRTGDGLSDTTVHTSGSGKFAIRFEPLSSATRLEWDIDIPTGNIQNNTMAVGVWCKINNANYYSATHQLPRLTVDYDNGSTAYAQAAQSTSWQLLIVPITPTTTYGQITCTISARTDQTTTNAYVYFDDFMVMYPPNVSLDLGGMDNWANALPVTPPLAIPISAKTVSSAVWEELKSSHTTADTYGDYLDDEISAVPDTVWDEARSGHVTAGTMGEAMTFMRKVVGWLRSLL